MTFPNHKILVNALIILWLGTACGGVKTVVTMDQKPGKTYQNVLIMAVTSEFETRGTFEKELAYRLGEFGYKAVPSVTLNAAHRKPYTVAELKQIVPDKGFDGVITLNLVDIKKKASYTRSSQYLTDPSTPFYFYNYLSAYNELYNWDYQTDKTVTIESRLFDVATEKEVFETSSKMKNAGSRETLAGAMGVSIAKAMKNSHLLKPTL